MKIISGIGEEAGIRVRKRIRPIAETIAKFAMRAQANFDCVTVSAID